MATFWAGVQIAITQPIRLEDVVMVEGEFGVIEEINFTYVVVRTWDQRRLVVPITYFIENTFQNWTKVSPEILGAILLYTDYSVPVDAIREELDRLLEGNEKWDGRTKAVQVTDATEKSMLVRILISAVNPSIAWELRVWIREQMITFIRENYPESLPRSRVILEQPEQDNQ
ncbi:MAG: mechanosensitive ion channel [Owenweeksia sp.]|nr:mechanosensitive ion channel [Owenweeksia sp.]